MNNSKLPTNNKGFTLMELVVYMGIFIIFITITTNIFNSVLDIQLESNKASATNQDARYLLERFTYDIQRADIVNIPQNPGDSSPTLQLSINGDLFTYSVVFESLELTNSSGAYKLNSDETVIKGISFQRLGNTNGKHTLTIEIELESRLSGASGPEEEFIHTTIGIR